ncbi:MAG: YjgP/YjgQ family permease [Puniceicoccaceae bacterium]|nr:MAG: YjgP/YjgQ family permease [Puniceicoccaceae bacterium]
MPLLHRYIFRSVFATCFFSVALVSFVLLTGNAIRDIIMLLADGQLGLWMTVRLLAILFPYVFSYALPLGMLAGILLVLGRISAQHEVTAMRSAGIGVLQMTSPILLLAVLGTALSLTVNFYFGPQARTSYREELTTAIRENPLGFIVERTFVRQFPGYVLYVGERDGRQLQDFWIWELDEAQRVRNFLRAETGYFDFDEETNSLILVLQRGQSEFRHPQEPENFARPRPALAFERASIQLPLDRIFGGESFRRKLSWMTFGELRAEAAALQTPEAAARPEARHQLLQVRMATQEKFAMAFSVLAFALLAVPLGIRVQRKETSANLALAVALAMGYYFLLIAIGWLDRYPALRPDLLLWLPNLLFQGLGIFLWWRLGRN